MVDINLIGDDKTGEEERVDDFTQTSSMDTQELAFEERTETFDTTKTAGFAQKRSYSSLISVGIIVMVIVLLGGSVYFFMFGGNDQPTPDDLTALNNDQLNADDLTATNGDPDLDQLAKEFEEDLGSMSNNDEQMDMNKPIDQPIDQPVQQPVRQQPIRQQPAQTPPPALNNPPVRDRVPTSAPPMITRDLSPASAEFLSSSRNAIKAITNVLTSMPANLNTTLLSYTAQRVRLEVVAATSTATSDFTGRLNQYLGSGNFKVVSENQVASNAGALEKVLISGSMASNGSVSQNESVRFMDLGQTKDWIRRSAQQFNLSVRQLTPQQGSFSGGFQKTPVLVRLYGNQSSIVSFLEEIAAQAYNIELAKILLVSPDMVNYSDENLILVLNMFLHEQA